MISHKTQFSINHASHLNCLITPAKVKSNDDSFNDSNDTSNSKVIFEYNDSHIVKIDEITLNHLK